MTSMIIYRNSALISVFRIIFLCFLKQNTKTPYRFLFQWNLPKDEEGICIILFFSLTSTGCRAKQASSVNMLWFKKVIIIRLGTLEATENIQDGVALCAFCHGISFADILPYLKCLPICMSCLFSML
jgi:hypothetical protein